MDETTIILIITLAGISIPFVIVNIYHVLRRRFHKPLDYAALHEYAISQNRATHDSGKLTDIPKV